MQQAHARKSDPARPLDGVQRALSAALRRLPCGSPLPGFAPYFDPEVQEEFNRYWRSRCAITPTFAFRGEVEMRNQIGVAYFSWGSDYPHHEGTWPYAETCLRHAFHGIEENETRRMLGANALDFCAFDREAMGPIENEIGPRPSEVIHPPEARPSEYVGIGLR